MPRRGVVVALSASELPNPQVTLSLPGYPDFATPVLEHNLTPRCALLPQLAFSSFLSCRAPGPVLEHNPNPRCALLPQPASASLFLAMLECSLHSWCALPRLVFFRACKLTVILTSE